MYYVYTHTKIHPHKIAIQIGNNINIYKRSSVQQWILYEKIGCWTQDSFNRKIVFLLAES